MAGPTGSTPRVWATGGDSTPTLPSAVSGRSQIIRARTSHTTWSMPAGISGVSRIVRTPGAEALTDFDRSVWGYGLDLFESVTGFPWPVGPSLFTPYSGHLAAGIDADDTVIDVTGDEPMLGGFQTLNLTGHPPIALEIGAETLLLTDTGTGPDDWTVDRGLLGTPVPHALGAAVTVGDDHGTGSIEADALTYTQPVAGTFVVGWGVFITDNGFGDHIAGTWTFTLRVNGSTIDSVDIEPVSGEVNDGWFVRETPDVDLEVNDELTIVVTSGTNPESLDEVSWAYIRVYGSY